MRNVVVPLFKNAARIDVPQPHDLRRNSQSHFSICIESKIHAFENMFDAGERKILGGLPKREASRPLAEIFFVFLENKIGHARRIGLPGKDTIDELLTLAGAQELLYKPELGLTTQRLGLRRSSKLLLAATLDKLLNEKRYQHLKTPEVCAGIADVIMRQGKDVLYWAHEISEGCDFYGLTMAGFCQNVLSQNVLDQSNADTSTGKYIRMALTAKPENSGVILTFDK